MYTYAVTLQSRNAAANTATVDQAVLATSNGRGGEDQGDGLGSTSFGSANDAGVGRNVLASAGVHIVMAFVGAFVVLWLKT